MLSYFFLRGQFQVFYFPHFVQIIFGYPHGYELLVLENVGNVVSDGNYLILAQILEVDSCEIKSWAVL